MNVSTGFCVHVHSFKAKPVRSPFRYPRNRLGLLLQHGATHYFHNKHFLFPKFAPIALFMQRNGRIYWAAEYPL